MKQEEYISRLMRLFPRSFINYLNELILVPKTNLYFCLDDVESELDIKCKILEWCSRHAAKSQYYIRKKYNEEYRSMVRYRINEYLNTDFNGDQMKLIYQRLGNAINHDLTIKFVKSGYDMNVLNSEVQE